MDRVEVKSCHGRASLSMQVTSRASDETLFIATLLDPPFYGEVGASTYVIGPVSAFFCEMAEAWTGWDGVKRWASLDGELTHAVQGGGWSAGFALNEGNATLRFVCGTPPLARHWTTAPASRGSDRSTHDLSFARLCQRVEMPCSRSSLCRRQFSTSSTTIRTVVEMGKYDSPR